MRLALVQMAVKDGDVDANVAMAESMIREVAGSGQPDVVLLPELWTTGYAHEQWADIAESETPQVEAHIASLAASLGVTIGGSMITVLDDGQLVNRFTIIPPDESPIVFYDKSHLFEPMREKEFLSPGTTRVHTLLKTEAETTRAALSICYDLRFPTMYRASAHEGAELYLVTSAWPEPRCQALRIMATARAVENQAFLALCNRAGAGGDGTNFCGGSMVVSPTGDVLLDLGSDEGVGVVEIKLRLVTVTRSMLHVLQDDVLLEEARLV